jgi:hypothetical protein
MPAGRQPLAERNVQEMTIFRRAIIPGRRMAMVTAMLTTAAVLACVPAAPSSAAPARAAHTSTMATEQASPAADTYEECLTNDSTECASLTSTEIDIFVSTVSGVASRYIVDGINVLHLIKYFKGWWYHVTSSGHKLTLWSGYYEDGGDTGGAGANTNLCLADTSFTAPITFQPCGSNGTIWIEEPDNNGGNYNFNRYFVDNYNCEINSPGYESSGDCMVMSANSLRNGAPLYLDFPEAPGGGLYQDGNP